MLIEDQDVINSKFFETEFKCSKLAKNLRTQLFIEHFGLTNEESNLPIDDEMFRMIESRCKVILIIICK